METYSTGAYGMPRIGKNTGITRPLMRAADLLYAMVIFLFHPQDYGPVVMSHLIARGHGKRLYVHRSNEFRKVMPLPFLAKSKHPDLIQRTHENRLNRSEMIERFGYKRQIDIEASALIDEGMTDFLSLAMAQPEDHVQISKLLSIGPKNNPVYNKMLDNLPESENELFFKMKGISASPTQMRREYGPAHRISRQNLDYVPIQIRDLPDSPLFDSLDRGDIHIFEGSGDPRGDATLFALVDLAVLQWKRNRFALYGDTRGLVRVKDEVQGIRGVTQSEIHNVMTQMPKTGTITVHIGHSINFGDAKLNDDYANVLDRAEFYGTGSWNVALYHAGIAAGCMLDANRILYTDHRSRLVPDGYETYEDSSTSTSEDRKTKTVSKRQREHKREVTEAIDHRMSMNDQLMEYASGLMRAAGTKGLRLVRQGGNAWWEQVKMMGDPWGFPEITRTKVESFYEEMLQRPEFVTPSIGAIDGTSIGGSGKRIPSQPSSSKGSCRSSKMADTRSPVTKLKDALSNEKEKRRGPRSEHEEQSD